MHIREYHICMPISVEEYKIGQLYMIAKHSREQSGSGEGVAVIKNEPCHHPVHGAGQFTEKRIYLSSRLPSWIASIVPNIFYITEKAWNYYPYTITEHTCSFLPRFSINIESRYENNKGTSDNCLDLTAEDIGLREVDNIDIVLDQLQDKHYKPEEDPAIFKSEKTKRGPLKENWKETSDPIMCSYKVVRVKFEVWGLQTRVEDYVQKVIREILLLGHRQAFTWIDEWYGMSMEDLRAYEAKMQEETNRIVGVKNEEAKSASSSPSTPTNTPTETTPPAAVTIDPGTF